MIEGGVTRMGKPIVYCQGCGKSLREEEFDRRQAHVVENRPYCAACRPLEAEAPPAAPPKKAAAPVLRPGSSTRGLPPVARTARPPKTGLYVGAGLAAAALLLLVVFLASGPGSASEPSRSSVETPRSQPASAPPARTADPEALAALERTAASSTDP